MTTIRPIRKHGLERWQVDLGVIDGTRRRRTFKSRNEARAFAASSNRDRQALGNRWLQLDPAKKAEILEGLDEAARLGVSFRDLLEHWKTTADKPSGVLLHEAYDLFDVMKRGSGVSDLYLQQLHYQVGNFTRANAETDVAVIDAGTIARWLDELKLKPTTRETHLRRLSSFFEWCKRKKMIQENPCVQIDRVRLVTPDPEILSNEQCAALVATARAEDLGMLTYLGIALFCGVRPHETIRLNSKDIDLKRGLITMPASKAKVRNRRLVTITKPAMRCLRAGRKMPKQREFRTRFEKLRQAAGVKDWPHDALRKTCASHFYNIYGINKAVEQLGHSAAIMLRNYRQIVTEEQTNEWLEI